MSNSAERSSIVSIGPTRSWQGVELRELFEYRDLFFTLVWRDIKVLYAQTILGFSWAILNPLVQIVVYSVIFGRIAELDTEGIPYVLFSTVAIIPWTYMSEAMNQSSQSLVVGQGMLGKIYFPRLIYPLTAVLSKMVDFSISLLLLLAIMVYFGVTPTWNLLMLPFLLVLMMAVPAGIGMWLASLAIRFRDVRFAMNYVLRMLMFSAPIFYSSSTIPENWRIIYSLNPIVAVIEGFRACLLGGEIPWIYILPGSAVAIVMFVSGAVYFKRVEQAVVDVI